MNYQEKREKRISLFEETIQFCEREQKLIDAIQNTRHHTVVYKNPLSEISKPEKRWIRPCKIDISDRFALEVVQKSYEVFRDSKIGLVNIISGVKYSGGIMREIDKQEEYLSCCTTLYPCLNVPPIREEYISDYSRKQASVYTDIYIYTPDIIQIKANKDESEIMEQKDWLAFDVISCVGTDFKERIEKVNVSQENGYIGNNYKIEEYWESRFLDVLQIAACNKIDILILDILGLNACSVSIQTAKEVLKKALKQFEYCFRTVILPAFVLNVS